MLLLKRILLPQSCSFRYREAEEMAIKKSLPDLSSKLPYILELSVPTEV